MYTIKKTVDDFKVFEILDSDDLEQGNQVIYLLKKQNMTTSRALDIISLKFGIKKKDIGICGNKDKLAVTEQHISLPRKVNEINERSIELKYVCSGKKRLHLGDHKSNKFEIRVYDAKKFRKIDFFANYYGSQRFLRNNWKVGQCIVKRDFKKACELIGLDVWGNDYVGALQKKDVRFYFHSFQSYIFNKVLREIVKVKKSCFKVGNHYFCNEYEDLKIELASFESEDKRVLKVLREEGLDVSDFIIRQFPECVLEKVYRIAFVKVQDLKIKKEGNDHIVKFGLDPGSFATVCLEKIFGKQKVF